MRPATHFEERWLQGIELRLPEQETDPRCPWAKAMAAVCEPMVEKVRQAPDEVAINVTLRQLQDQYHLRYDMAPKAHKDHIGTRNGHICIFQLYRAYYSQLRELLLAVNPPPLRPLPPPPGPPQVAGVLLGLELKE